MLFNSYSSIVHVVLKIWFSIVQERFIRFAPEKHETSSFVAFYRSQSDPCCILNFHVLGKLLRYLLGVTSDEYQPSLEPGSINLRSMHPSYYSPQLRSQVFNPMLLKYLLFSCLGLHVKPGFT